MRAVSNQRARLETAKGCTVFSQKERHSVSGASVKKSIFFRIAVARDVRRDPGRCVVSASVKSSQSPEAAFEPTNMAWFFPVQPGGSFSTRTTFSGTGD